MSPAKFGLLYEAAAFPDLAEIPATESPLAYAFASFLASL